MQSQINPTLKAFLDRLVYFKVFNGVFLLWILAQLIFFIVTTVSISCSKMKNIFIGWTCSYAFQFFVPIAVSAIVHFSKYYAMGYVYVSLMVAYKVAVVVTVLSMAWNHVGLCYIPYSMRVTIIITNCAQICVLLVQILLLWRIKKVRRQVLVDNLIHKKTFAEPQ